LGQLIDLVEKKPSDGDWRLHRPSRMKLRANHRFREPAHGEVHFIEFLTIYRRHLLPALETPDHLARLGQCRRLIVSAGKPVTCRPSDDRHHSMEPRHELNRRKATAQQLTPAPDVTSHLLSCSSSSASPLYMRMSFNCTLASGSTYRFTFEHYVNLFANPLH
jgi:hypothetical protein